MNNTALVLEAPRGHYLVLAHTPLLYWPAAGNENTYYIVSPRDIVMAKPRTADDHVAWLLAKGRYEDAYLAAMDGERIKELKQFTVCIYI
jgi:hypothetical protein